MLGLLLSRAGVDVVVLEKHPDFFRDFRGDTIHPSTLDVLGQLGLLEALLRLPHQELTTVSATFHGTQYQISDFSRLPTQSKFIALMPQWGFLNFLVRHANQYPTFHLRMNTEFTDLIEEGGRVVGVRARSPQGPIEVRCALVVGADGRHSRVRDRTGLAVHQSGVPIDVLWLRIPKNPMLPPQSLGYLDRDKFMVLIDRSDYFQCGYLIPKGGFPEIQERGLATFRASIAALAPATAQGVEQLRSWDEVSLLTVLIDRLDRWSRPGVLCIGDAAHAMSPVGGVGINLAIQDAVATANLLAEKLRSGRITAADLDLVQQRREYPARAIQRMQAFVHRHLLNAEVAAGRSVLVRCALILVHWIPALGRVPARFIGVGPRPERVEIAEWSPP